jgi:hypothetical protein
MNLNKPKIMRNSGELNYLDYLPTTQKMHNIKLKKFTVIHEFDREGGTKSGARRRVR